ncbi:MAG: nuclear transport factor 2 family protein [Gammaproteobacteria bacterium]|nr:nuclear transport factor 2 family protein [Gammaproteobacteria bacterium]
MSLGKEQMLATIRTYFGACSAADKPRLMRYFTPDAVHYFPSGSPFGALRGSEAIADCWCRCVGEWGSSWTVDSFIGDEATRQAVIEWTHFKPKIQAVLRGDEWYRFDENGLIIEIRAYYACPAQRGVAVHEIAEYPYAAFGYPLTP